MISSLMLSIAASIFSNVEVIGIVGTNFPDIGWEILKSHNMNYDKFNEMGLV